MVQKPGTGKLTSHIFYRKVGKGKKTIVLVGNTSWGMYNFRKNTVEEIAGKGFEVVIMAPEDDHTAKLQSLPVTFIPLKHMRGSGTNPLTDLLLFFELRAHYRRIRPDIIFHYTVKPNIYGTLAAHFSNVYNIAFTTGLGYAFMSHTPVTWLIKKLYRLSVRYADQVWFLNRDDLADFKRLGILRENSYCIVNGEGIDTAFYSPAPNEYTREETTFLLPARMLLEKGVMDFVQAVEILKGKGLPVRAVLAGRIAPGSPGAISLADLDGWTEKGIAEYSGSVADIRPLIRQCDCVVLPSYYREGIPRTLLEAGAMERAAITTDTAGCRDVIRHGYNGLLCQPRNPADLARQMEAFIRLPREEKKRMAQNARAKILDVYDQAIINRHYLDVIDSVLSKS